LIGFEVTAAGLDSGDNSGADGSSMDDCSFDVKLKIKGLILVNRNKNTIRIDIKLPKFTFNILASPSLFL
jgi:hypothetical protein